MSGPLVLLTGASGLVGTWLCRSIPDEIELVVLTHRSAVAGRRSVRADLRDAAAVTAAFEQVSPSMVIHAAWRLDAPSILDATTNVVAAAAAVGADVVHLSTDVVFSGDGRRVDETTAPDPVFDHGRWKAESETIALQAPVSSCVVRLPLVVSVDPADRSMSLIRAAAAEGRTTRWFDDEFRRPAMAADIAGGLWRIAALPPDRRSGVWHLGGPELLSRFEIALRMVDALNVDRRSVVAEPAPADVVRPRNVDMHSERARAEIDWQPSPILA